MLKINFLGDSITEGAAASSQDNTFVALVGKMLPCIARNYGISGTRIAKQYTPSENQRYDLDFVTRVDDLNEDADFVIVFGGTNDYGHGDAPFGKMGSTTNKNFCGAVYSLFNKLLKKFTKEQIIVIPPLHRLDEDNPLGDGSKKKPGKPLSAYREVIINTAEQFGVRVLDIVNKIGPAEENPLIADGLHPNDEGHHKIAELICEYINKLI